MHSAVRGWVEESDSSPEGGDFADCDLVAEGGGVRSGPGEARTILLLHIISARPSQHPLMVRTFLKVYMEQTSSSS